jgi:RNA recognition motif-containing protein
MSKRLFVGGLPYEMTDEKLQEMFSACGRVEKVKVMFDRATGRSKGFGFIEMATDLEGNAAILKFDGTNIGTRNISVKEAKPAENRRREGGPGGGRPQRDNRPSPGGDHRREGSGFGDPRGAHSNGFSKPQGQGGFGGSNNRGSGSGRPSGNGGPGGSSGRGGYAPSSMVGPGKSTGRGGFRTPGPSGDKGTSSDWRSELGLGNNQRKDFRRTNRDHNSRNQSRRHDGDNFGNR